LYWNIIAKPNGGIIEDFQFIENFRIRDDVPVQLEYVSFEKIYLPNGVTISSPTVSDTTSEGTTVTWNVNGIVAGDEYVHIRVETKVVIMPLPGEEIKNIACLILDKKSKKQVCDEATTTPGDSTIPGELSIAKTLIGNGIVMKTGDLIKWQIEVENEGGPASSFSIVDRLPAELEYVSYEVTNS